MTASAHLPIDERLLTPLLKLIVRAVGPADAMRLLKQRGGTVLKLYEGSGRSRVLDEIVGAEQGQRLIEALAPRDRVSLPKHDKITQQLRNLVIRAEQHTKSAAEQALEHDLTVRQILNIRAEREAIRRAGAQPDLFEPAEDARNGL
jgi:hypothetical protein